MTLPIKNTPNQLLLETTVELREMSPYAEELLSVMVALSVREVWLQEIFHQILLQWEFHAAWFAK